eukprot:s6389_g1.t1
MAQADVHGTVWIRGPHVTLWACAPMAFFTNMGRACVFWSAFGPAMANAEAAERHQAEATRLRSEIEQLVQRARLLLHGDAANKPLAPRPPHPRRAERERELEEALEKAEWYRREIKRMRQELESRDRHSQMSNPWDARDKDPMELYNLLAERRKELQQLQRVSEGLEHAAEVQRKAENAQSAVRPEIEERLQKVKMEVDQQKRLNVKLQADRLKLSNQRKAIEEEIRKVGSELRSKAALLHRKGPTGQEKGSHTVLEQLRREVDILRGALRQDERKHRAMLKEDSQEVDFAAAHMRFAAMANESNANRNRLFEIVRDGSYAEAKKIVRDGSYAEAKKVRFAAMANESNANRNRFFEIVRDGSYAEAKKLGFEVNYRDYARKTALFFAIENGHLDVADFLIERAASIKVQSKEKKTPLSMLKALNHKAPQNKRKWASPTPSCVCPGAATRSRFAQWEWA